MVSPLLRKFYIAKTVYLIYTKFGTYHSHNTLLIWFGNKIGNNEPQSCLFLIERHFSSLFSFLYFIINNPRTTEGIEVKFHAISTFCDNLIQKIMKIDSKLPLALIYRIWNYMSYQLTLYLIIGSVLCEISQW